MKSVDFTLLFLAMILQRTQNFTVDMNQVLLIIRNNRVMYAGINMFWARLGVICSPRHSAFRIKMTQRRARNIFMTIKQFEQVFKTSIFTPLRNHQWFFSTYTIIGQFSQPYFNVRPAKFKRLLEFKYSSAI